MADNLPLALDMDAARVIAVRAETAYDAALAGALFAYAKDGNEEHVRREFALSMYRRTMRDLGEAPDADSETAGGSEGAPAPGKRRGEPENANGEGSGRWEATEEFDCLVEATPVPTNGAKR